MRKQNLTEYSNNELSLMVFNDEYLYNRRHTSNFIDLLDELFIYNDEQLEVLQNDLNDDLLE